MSNTYWPIYKNLEKELIEISRIIRVCDEQLNVYSDKILELLIRCAIEIESISKELFFLNGGAKPQDRDLYFDTDCINLLEDKWKISKKKLIISCSNFYLVKDENRTIVPLKKANKRGTSGSDWKKAYQAVKHDRRNNMKMANIKHLIRALGALYILNLYYKDETFNINNTNDDRFQYSLSDIFSFSIHSFEYNGINYLKNDNFDECVYLITLTDKNKENLDTWNSDYDKFFMQELIKNSKVNDFIISNYIKDNSIDQERLSRFLLNHEYTKTIENSEIQNIMQNALKLTYRKLKFNVADCFNSYKTILNKNQTQFCDRV